MTEWCLGLLASSKAHEELSWIHHPPVLAARVWALVVRGVCSIIAKVFLRFSVDTPMRFHPTGSDVTSLGGILNEFTAEDFQQLRKFARSTGLSLSETFECLWMQVQKKLATRSTDG